MASVHSHGSLVSNSIMVFVISVFSLQVTSLATRQEPTGLRVKLIPIYSDDSPMNPGNLTDEQRYGLILQLSRARSSSRLYARHSIKDQSVNTSLIHPEVREALESLYIVEVRIGSEKQRHFLQLDTGSDLTWVQCADCVNCFDIHGGSYAYENSKSFFRVKCRTYSCNPDHCDSNLNCVYEIRYADMSTSRGLRAWDDFTFGEETVKNLLFGCGISNSLSLGRNAGSNNDIAGIFGMSRGYTSFLSQMGFKRFSYCLTHWTQRGSVTYLKFGRQATFPPRIRYKDIHRTTFLPSHQHYDLSLLDIHVDGLSIGTPRDSLGTITIDTGAAVTELLFTAYAKLKLAIRRYYERTHFDLQPYDATDHPNFSDLKFCFRKPRNFNSFPKITFIFQRGAQLTPTDRGAFAIFDDFFCLQIQHASDEISVLGAFTQTDHIFVHDIERNQLAFAYAGDCTSA